MIEPVVFIVKTSVCCWCIVGASGLACGGAQLRRRLVAPPRLPRHSRGRCRLRRLILGVTLAATAWAPAAWAQEAGDAPGTLARAKLNPLASEPELPATLSFGFGVGPRRETEPTLNFQPRVPLPLTENWRIITRSNLSITHLPSPEDVTGLGDIDVSLFLTPARTGAWVWGVGPIFQFPTATDPALGTEKWSAGPTAALVYVDGPWVNGVLVNHLWSFAGRRSREDVSLTQIEAQVSYAFSNGWYVQSNPTFVHDDKAPRGEDWTVPIGVDVGREFSLGSQGMSLQVGAYYNVKKPTGAAEWTLETQFSLVY
jgi:hypothetical protein